MRRVLVTLLFALAMGGVANAAAPLYQFDTRAQAQRFDTLIWQFRCLVCQGESIAVSNADLAQDMRDQIHDMIMAGRSNQQIIDFMTDRYGAFILYEPPFAPRTYLLWIGPLLLLMLAGAGMMYYAWGLARRDKGSSYLQRGERERLSRLLDEPSESKTNRTQT